jgi:hypothetical protein
MKQLGTVTRIGTVGALAVGVAVGGYGVASAAPGKGTGKHARIATTPGARAPGGQRSDETLLTGAAAASVTAVALAKVPGGTIVRVETDGDGHAMYEAHVKNASGAQVTVYVDKDFNFVSLETRSKAATQKRAKG